MQGEERLTSPSHRMWPPASILHTKEQKQARYNLDSPLIFFEGLYFSEKLYMKNFKINIISNLL